MRAPLLALLLLALPLAGCAAPDAPPAPAAPTAPPSPPAPPAPGTSGANASAPPAGANATGPWWAFTDTQGAQHTRDTAAGKPTVLFFMASWCGSCRAMTPRLAAVHADYADRVGFHSVSFDRSDDAASLERWKQQYRQPWPHGVDPGFGMQRTFQIVSQSSVVLLDARGEVAQKWGYPGASEAALREAVERALGA